MGLITVQISVLSCFPPYKIAAFTPRLCSGGYVCNSNIQSNYKFIPFKKFLFFTLKHLGPFYSCYPFNFPRTPGKAGRCICSWYFAKRAGGGLRGSLYSGGRECRGGRQRAGVLIGSASPGQCLLRLNPPGPGCHRNQGGGSGQGDVSKKQPNILRGSFLRAFREGLWGAL